ncbi:MAG: hypothetical protein LR015_05110 [Verrucomicrobia bacterium]|nr:hypothetical protein [Verrucomicrobiota bacterium]
MFKLSDHWLGDTWYYVEQDVAHMFYLFCPRHIERHTCWSIGHATSSDLRTWTDHGELFGSRPEDPLNACLSTGSVTRWRSSYLMACLANHNHSNPRVVYATSPDLYEWQWVAGVDCDLHSSGYSRRGSLPFKNPRWRDPFVFTHEGYLHQLITAANDSLPPEADGVIGHMRTVDLHTWEFFHHWICME